MAALFINKQIVVDFNNFNNCYLIMQKSKSFIWKPWTKIIVDFFLVLVTFKKGVVIGDWDQISKK